VTKYTTTGQVLLDIEVGGQPSPCRNNFCSTTDIAFAANGHLFISDGYANARVLEYSADGKKIREWGAPGTGPGQFNLVHSIQIGADGLVYVADRENGRVQRFDQSGKFLGEWVYGKTFGLKTDGGFMWLATQPLQQPNLSPGWLLKVDTKTGKIAGWVPSAGNHGMDVMTSGDLLLGPGPGLVPQRYSPR
jgi:DNA-binding beta-propeller fold protein YncE